MIRDGDCLSLTYNISQHTIMKTWRSVSVSAAFYISIVMWRRRNDGGKHQLMTMSTSMALVVMA